LQFGSGTPPTCDDPSYSELVIRVAVKLPVATGRIGDYVADVTALDAAGADSIWVDASRAANSEPWILLGAIAAVTHRARLGVTVGSSARWPDAIDALGRMSSGRVVVGVPSRREMKTLAVQLESQRSASPPPSILIACSTQHEAEASAHLADGVILPGGDDEVRALRAARAQDGDFEIWIDAPVPADRAGWTNMISTLEAAGATGVMVPWDPRLIDLVRNAGEPDDRTDLLIATG